MNITFIQPRQTISNSAYGLVGYFLSRLNKSDIHPPPYLITVYYQTHPWHPLRSYWYQTQTLWVKQDELMMDDREGRQTSDDGRRMNSDG